jgi:hypothetical protein
MSAYGAFEVAELMKHPTTMSSPVSSLLFARVSFVEGDAVIRGEKQTD